MKSLVS